MATATPGTSNEAFFERGHPTSSNPESPTEHEFEFSDSANVTGQEDIPPDGGYGWVCTVCVFLINAHTWGVNSV